MESLHDSQIVHRDHEPGRRVRAHGLQQTARDCRPCALTRRFRTQFMERSKALINIFNILRSAVQLLP